MKKGEKLKIGHSSQCTVFQLPERLRKQSAYVSSVAHRGHAPGTRWLCRAEWSDRRADGCPPEISLGPKSPSSVAEISSTEKGRAERACRAYRARISDFGCSGVYLCTTTPSQTRFEAGILLFSIKRHPFPHCKLAVYFLLDLVCFDF